MVLMFDDVVEDKLSCNNLLIEAESLLNIENFIRFFFLYHSPDLTEMKKKVEISLSDEDFSCEGKSSFSS